MCKRAICDFRFCSPRLIHPPAHPEPAPEVDHQAVTAGAREAGEVPVEAASAPSTPTKTTPWPPLAVVPPPPPPPPRTLLRKDIADEEPEPMPPMELDMQQAASAAPADAESRTARAPVVVVVPPAAPAPEPQTSLMVGSAISKTKKKARLSADGAYSVSVNTVPGHKTAGTMATSAGAAAEAAFGFAAAARRVAQEAATAAESAALAAAAARQFAKEAAASAQQAELAAAAAAATV